MEDEGSYGNDDIRCFILSNLATARMAKTFCIVCSSAIQIYDRYPLIDGTFFLSPKQYSKACIPVRPQWPFSNLILKILSYYTNLSQILSSSHD